MTQDRFSKSPKSRPMVGKRGGDDGLVQRREEHAQHEAVEDLAHVRLGQRRVRLGGSEISFGRLVWVSARGCHSVKISSAHRVFPMYPLISPRNAVNATHAGTDQL